MAQGREIHPAAHAPEQILQVQHRGRQEAFQQLDLGARTGKQLGRRFDRSLDLGVDRKTRACIEMQSDPEALGLERTGVPVVSPFSKFSWR